MKSFWAQLMLSILVGLIVAYVFYSTVPSWTRADLISIFTLIVAVWNAAIARWSSISQGELARFQLDKEKRALELKKKGSVLLTLERKSNSTHCLYVKNNGDVDITELDFVAKPISGTDMPSFIPEHPNGLPPLKPKDKVILAYVAFDQSSGSSFSIEVKWKDPSGTMQSDKQIVTYN